jgi:hypothetical protein
MALQRYPVNIGFDKPKQAKVKVFASILNKSLTKFIEEAIDNEIEFRLSKMKEVERTYVEKRIKDAEKEAKRS